MDVSQDFGPFEDRIWLNCSHQGPLPRVAVEAAQEAIQMKTAPHRLARSQPFQEVPDKLRMVLGRLVNAEPDDIILGNSTSFGLNLLASGIRWRIGDEVLLVEGDFPATIFPWLALREKGVTTRFIRPAGASVSADELSSAIRPETRLFCTTWVHSFTGHAVDAYGLGEVCRQHDVLFALNASQGIGARRFDLKKIKVDMVTSCGFKWLCGPYGTGFCWISPEVREELQPTKAYWLANLTAEDLRGGFEYELRQDLGARAYDLFCTANFLNFKPWTKSVEYLLAIGIEDVSAHNSELVSDLISRIDTDRYEILSPVHGPARTAIVVLRHRVESANARCFDTLAARGIDIALRRDCLRIAPHLYNTREDIEACLKVLNSPHSPEVHDTV
jgi:selenocysteine lyase/cysteine desulfurase